MREAKLEADIPRMQAHASLAVTCSELARKTLSDPQNVQLREQYEQAIQALSAANTNTAGAEATLAAPTLDVQPSSSPISAGGGRTLSTVPRHAPTNMGCDGNDVGGCRREANHVRVEIAPASPATSSCAAATRPRQREVRPPDSHRSIVVRAQTRQDDSVKSLQNRMLLLQWVSFIGCTPPYIRDLLQGVCAHGGVMVSVARIRRSGEGLSARHKH